MVIQVSIETACVLFHTYLCIHCSIIRDKCFVNLEVLAIFVSLYNYLAPYNNCECFLSFNETACCLLINRCSTLSRSLNSLLYNN